MAHALEKVKQTGEGKPGLGAKHIARLEAILQQVEKSAAVQPGHE
jgi:hypothetical protein